MTFHLCAREYPICLPRHSHPLICLRNEQRIQRDKETRRRTRKRYTFLTFDTLFCSFQQQRKSETTPNSRIEKKKKKTCKQFRFRFRFSRVRKFRSHAITRIFACRSTFNYKSFLAMNFSVWKRLMFVRPKTKIIDGFDSKHLISSLVFRARKSVYRTTQ